MTRILSVIGISLFSLVIVLAGFWLYFTYTIEQPYDEVWIGLNSNAPAPLRAWSCKTVKARMTRPGLAPMGCEGHW